MEKHRLFIKVSYTGSSHPGIEIEHFRYNNDITVNDLLPVKKTEVNFERKQSIIFISEQVINECAIYDIIAVTGLVYNLQTEAEYRKDGKTLRLRKGMIKNETGDVEIVRFSLLLEEITHPVISRK